MRIDKRGRIKTLCDNNDNDKSKKMDTKASNIQYRSYLEFAIKCDNLVNNAVIFVTFV